MVVIWEVEGFFWERTNNLYLEAKDRIWPRAQTRCAKRLIVVWVPDERQLAIYLPILDGIFDIQVLVFSSHEQCRPPLGEKVGTSPLNVAHP